MKSAMSSMTDSDENKKTKDSGLIGLAHYYRDTASIHGITQAGGERLYAFRR